MKIRNTRHCNSSFVPPGAGWESSSGRYEGDGYETPTSILLTVILLAMPFPALAVDRTFQIEVENSLKGSVPSNWWLHASWRDQTLVVFVSPPTQESFNLWYDTPRQKETLEDLCKAIPVAVWDQIQPDQDIAVEQVVGGNGGKGSFQFSCRKYLANSTD
jgi:hypothetical protein